MLNTLCESASRFIAVMPRRSYGNINFNYVIEVSPDDGTFQIHPFGKDGIELSIPRRWDRSAAATEKNLKPYPLADKAMYVLGIPDKGGENRAALAHEGFINALLFIYKETQSMAAGSIHRLLKDEKFKKEMKAKGIKAGDWIAFRTDPEKYFYDDDRIAQAWENYLENECAAGETECCICGKTKRVLRIYPWQISLMGYSCPISSFNAKSFESFGESQTTNSPTCYDCAGTASQVLQYLIDTERHNAVLSKDDAKGEGKTPLKNQLAVFWTKAEFIPAHMDEAITINFEELNKAIFDFPDIEDGIGPPAHEEQLKQLCKIPWNTSRAALEVQDNAFYLAIISPNKSRLVLRDWVEVTLANFLRNVGLYTDALSIIAPDGQKGWAPPIPAIFEALKPVKTMLSKKDDDIFIPEKQDSNILRGLLRCCYAGSLPPTALLERAVLRFRIFGKEPELPKQKMRLEARRMALVAAMKLVLHYPFLREAETQENEIYEEEVRRMEQLDEKEGKPSYLCGRLLATLEEIQCQHAFPKKLNATLVDRFYGSASTAPQSVFGTLLSMATKAHMAKLRKERFKKHEELEELLEDVSARIMKGCGFPKTLNMQEQAEFALGFYTQRAVFRKQRGEILTKS